MAYRARNNNDAARRHVRAAGEISVAKYRGETSNETRCVATYR